MAILKVPYNGEWAIIESPSAVKFTEQTLSDAEKARARANIGAVTADEVSITVDDALSTTSANPVQNKVVNAAIENLSNLVGETPVPEQISIAIANNLIGAPGTGTNAEIFNATSGTIQNVASGSYAHAEGYSTAAEANYTHAEGYNTDAKKDAAHAEGDSTVANSKASHTEGYRTTTLGYAAHAEGHSNAVCPTDIAYGTDNADVIAAWNTNKFALAKGYGAHSEGSSSLALGDYSHAEGYRSIASGESAHSEGDTTVASGNRAHAEGYQTTASANFTHAEGGSTAASGQYAHAEGNGAIASGAISHAEGSITRAKGYAAHAEGSNTTSIGQSAHAEGQSTYKAPDTITSSTTKANIIAEHKNTKFTLANGMGAHTEGYDTLSLGEASHAEGYRSIASGDYAHAEGADTVASGMRSHAEGYGTIASSTNQHVQGKYNIEDATAQYAHIVGNGSTAADPSNAHTLDWDGNAWFAGDVTVGTGKKTLATTEYVDNAVATSSPNIEVDKTLSIEGMAADAKATGDALNEKASIYVNEDAGADLPDGYDIYIDTTDCVSQIPMIPGIVYATASQILPEGFLWCNGAEVSRSEYFELFNSIGTAYGVGDGSTTFNVPDLQLRVPMGAGGEFGLGTMGGEAEHVLIVDEMPWHSHTNIQSSLGQTLSSNYGTGATGYGGVSTNVGNPDYPYFTGGAGGSAAHNNMQPYTVVNYIISTGKGAQINALDIVAGIQTLPLAAEYGGTGFNNLTSLGEALNATGTVGAFTFEEVNF